jgi:pSer/pThr/pTyr-binding forkhead associated (FHA) protein
MEPLEFSCTNETCKKTFKVDPSDWGDEEFVNVNCPTCGQLVEKIMNPKKKPSEGKRESGRDMGAGAPTPVRETSRRVFTKEEAEKIKTLAWLVKITGKVGVFELNYGKQTVGRENSTKKSDVPIPTKDATTSGAHCLIEINIMSQGFLEYQVSDNKSLNGVYVGSSEKLKEGEKIHLLNGIKIILGGNVFIFLSIEKVSSKEDALNWVKRNVK